MSMLVLRRMSRAGGQGAAHRGLRVTAVTVAVAGLLAAGCTAGPRGGSNAPSPATAASAAAVGSPAVRAGVAGQCDPGTTCYTPAQLQVAYGIKPLLDRGIDGRGETIVLPELAETRLDPPLVTDLRPDMAGFDHLFRLPAARMRVVTTLAGASLPGLPSGRKCWTWN
jgi:hypothetical protein